jgi:glyoxylase I family protein
MAIQHLSHIGICVSDLETSRRFYTDLLGFTELHELAVVGPPVETLLEIDGADLRALYLERDGVVIELLYFASPGHIGERERRPMNQLGFTHLSLRVDDIDATLAELRAGGALVADFTRTGHPSLKAGAVFLTDPDGTRIELVQAPGDPKVLPGA